MSATAPETAAPQGGFSIKKLGEPFTFPVTMNRRFPGLEWWFTLRNEIEADTKALKEMFAGQNASEHRQRVERLVRLATKAPVGFSDFPTDGDLASNIRSYFADEIDSGKLLVGVFSEYEKWAYPDQLFR